MKGIIRNLVLTFTTITFASIVAIAAPFKKEVCDLGWEHVHHDHSEEAYQQAWCSAHNGVMEHQNKDFTRVDCLTDTHAVEFDFANKWHESIGQALHYSVMTGKRAKIVLILDEPKIQMTYYKRIRRIGKRYNFDTEYVTNDILKINTNGKCFYSNCKCNRELKNHVNDNFYSIIKK